MPKTIEQNLIVRSSKSGTNNKDCDQGTVEANYR